MKESVLIMEYDNREQLDEYLANERGSTISANKRIKKGACNFARPFFYLNPRLSCSQIHCHSISGSLACW